MCKHIRDDTHGGVALKHSRHYMSAKLRKDVIEYDFMYIKGARLSPIYCPLANDERETGERQIERRKSKRKKEREKAR